MNRLQIELNENQNAELIHLQQLGGLRTKKELFDNAFTILRWAARQVLEGNIIVSMDIKTGVMRELDFPYLENVRSHHDPGAIAPRSGSSEINSQRGAPVVAVERDAQVVGAQGVGSSKRD